MFDNKLEITKMLTVSSAHVTQETFDRLVMDNENNKIGLPVYTKNISNNSENYGLYIYINPDINRGIVPSDLMPLIDLAVNNDCDILCLDGDGPELTDYPVFKWED